MNAYEPKETMYKSYGLQLIIAGLTTLIEDEGYSIHEAFRLLKSTKNNVFPALLEVQREVNDEDNKRDR